MPKIARGMEPAKAEATVTLVSKEVPLFFNVVVRVIAGIVLLGDYRLFWHRVHRC